MATFVSRADSTNSRSTCAFVWTAVVICAIWILAGLVGHEPWKQDEAYTFGLVYHILETGDWVVPTLAGEPFMEKPPIFCITASAIARLLSPPLELHDTARLTSGLFMIIAVVFLVLTMREMASLEKGRLASLALLGCIGLP